MLKIKRPFHIVINALLLIFLAVGVTFTIGSLNQNDIVLTDFTHIAPASGGGANIRIGQSSISFTYARLIGAGDTDLFADSALDDQDKSSYASYYHETFRGPDAISWRYPDELERSEKLNRYYLVLEPVVCGFIPNFISSNLEFAESCKTPKYIELIRQTPAYLETIGMNKADGYTIAGRTNLALPMTADLSPRPVVQFEAAKVLPDITIPEEVRTRLSTDNPAVLEAVRLANIFYVKPIRIGTAGISHSEFSVLPIETRLELIWSGKSAFQCAGMRDMWLEMAASSTRIPKARYVGAYNYYPPFKDLIPYSHALAEFWAPEWNKWVGIDPWFGFMFRLDGVFLSATELTQLSATEKKDLEMLPIVPLIQQYTQSLDGERSYSIHEVKDGGPPLSSVWENGSYRMGYLDYFNAVDFGAPMTTKEPAEQ